jgi:L,D-transpeptidase catalytic domain
VTRRIVPSRVAATALVVFAVIVAGCGNTTALRHDDSPKVETKAAHIQELAALLDSHEAYAQPSSGSKPIELLQARRPLTGEQTVLPVLGETTTKGRVAWLYVMVPGRPNGRRGWILERGTTASTTSWSIVVDTTTRLMTIDEYGQPVRTVKVVVGKASTPTPLGEFFVEEVVKMPPSAVGAPYAFALSAFSNVLQDFDGGPGQIALHGLENVGGVLGTAASHGCVRVASATLDWMVTRIGPGTPVTIMT